MKNIANKINDSFYLSEIEEEKPKNKFSLKRVKELRS